MYRELVEWREWSSLLRLTERLVIEGPEPLHCLQET